MEPVGPDLRLLARADGLFDRALDLPPSRRPAFLDEECGGDLDLRRLVEELLAASDEDDTRLDGGGVGAIAGALADGSEDDTWILDGPAPDELPLGVRVGPFELVGLLGRGGMGSVYLARRVEGGFDQEVALKVGREGHRSQQFLERFEQERRLLAGLDHPHVARLLEGGSTPRGRPWFALERVDGERIDDHCDRAGLGVRARVELFLQVASAVAYAHSQLVVHRDLKPANILVTRDGRAKLLDFGIAKLLAEEDGAAVAPATRTIHRVFTPEYASPEQMRGESVTTAVDVFQLGLVLYELLTGRRPWAREGPLAFEAGPPDAPTPSTVWATDDESAEAGQNRGADSRTLRQQLRGDLDAILLKALRPDPRDRYGSVEQLAEDLRRHLDGRPVLARKGTFRYLAGRALRRHRAVAVGSALVLFLLAGWAVTATRQARALTEERDRAQAEATRAREVTSFLVDLFEVSGPDRALGREPTAREILERGADELRTRLDDQPLVRAELLGTVGDVYRKLGLYDESLPMVREAVELAAGPDDNRTLQGADTTLARARSRLALLLWQTGELHEASERFAEALDGDLPDVERAAVLADYGAALFHLGEHEAGDAALQEALALQRRLHGADSAEVAHTLGQLAESQFSAGDAAAAEATLRQSLGAARAALGPDHPDVLETLSEIAYLRVAAGDLDEAGRLLDEAIERGTRVLGPDHPGTLAFLFTRTRFLDAAGRPDEATALRQDLVERFEGVFGRDHVQTLTVLNDLAIAHHDAGRYDEAEPLYREVLARNRELYGPVHLRVAQNLYNLGQFYSHQDRLAEAERVHREALEVWRGSVGPDHPGVARSEATVGMLQVARGAVIDAEDLLRHAIGVYETAEAPAGTDAARPRIALVWILLDSGRADEAVSLAREADEMRAASEADDSARRAESRAALGCALAAVGSEEAGPILEKALSVLAERRGEDHWVTERARAALGPIPPPPG